MAAGGPRGIGKAIVLELARRGANAAVRYLKSPDEAEKMKARIAERTLISRAVSSSGVGRWCRSKL